MLNLFSFLLPALAYAQDIPGITPAPKVDGFSSIGSLVSTACTVTGWIFTGAILLSIVFILIAGITYITSGGNPEKTKKAGTMLVYVAIGIAVALIAYVFPTLIATTLGADLTNVCS